MRPLGTVATVRPLDRLCQCVTCLAYTHISKSRPCRASANWHRRQSLPPKRFTGAAVMTLSWLTSRCATARPQFFSTGLASIGHVGYPTAHTPRPGSGCIQASSAPRPASAVDEPLHRPVFLQPSSPSMPRSCRTATTRTRTRRGAMRTRACSPTGTTGSPSQAADSPRTFGLRAPCDRRCSAWPRGCMRPMHA